jgi:hypothetical protein
MLDEIERLVASIRSVTVNIAHDPKARPGCAAVEMVSRADSRPGMGRRRSRSTRGDGYRHQRPALDRRG